jgi:ribosome biogenesis GTPase
MPLTFESTLASPTLKDYGWDAFFESHCPDRSSGTLGRVIADHGHSLTLFTDSGTQSCPQGLSPDKTATVGDWLLFSSHGIESVLPRKSKLSRMAAGIETKEQLIAANIDYLFILQSLNEDFNLKRLDRYLIAAWDSGALPVIVLSKSDLCREPAAFLERVESVAAGVSVFAVSSTTGDGLADLETYLKPGKTIAFVGSSGVGKSTLVNQLSGGHHFRTQDIREDDAKGRHTTTHRELIRLESGALLIDTPGMRTFALWQNDTGFEKVFGEIEQLAENCRFKDCTHTKEPGCAVRAALRDGTLDPERLENFKKLKRELQFTDAKQKQRLRIIERRSHKTYSRKDKHRYERD